MEWIEATGSTVDVAVAAAVAELGIRPEEADVEILQEPKSGFLGLGSQDAVVKVVRKPKAQGRRRRRRPKRANETGRAANQNQNGPRRDANKNDSRRGGRKMASAEKNSPKRSNGRQKKEERAVSAPDVSIEEQGEMAKDFLVGLLEAFGLEGEVEARVEDEILFLDVTGDQTEALVGPKGSILHAIHELTRTVIQRKTFRAPRMRIDIAGYTERRRAALKIFAAQVAAQVIENQGEIALDPMNPADRKVLHDAVGEIEGVRTFSEGEDPNRAVVIALVEE